MRLLLIGQDVSLSDNLIRLFRRNKYEADASYDGKDGEAKALTGVYDLIILDRKLPKQNGLNVLKKIRKNNVRSPVLFLTAKHGTADNIKGLDAGADDYLVKPFSEEELLARIRALTRRNTNIVKTEEIIIGKSKFLPKEGELRLCHNYDNCIKLTFKETKVLEMLVKNNNTAVSKEDILQELWGIKNDVKSNLVEVFISYVRKKIKPDLCGFTICTQRNVGYSIKVI